MQPNFEQFVASRSTNLWIKEPGLSLYVRKSITPGLYDLANVNATKIGNGAYSNFLLRFGPDYPFRIEHVITDRFADFHRRLGWAEMPCQFGVPSFFSPLAVERGLGLRSGVIFHAA